MTSTPDDRSPDAGAGVPHVPAPPSGTAGDAPTIPLPPTGADAGGTGAGAERPAPSADDTQPLGLGDTRPLPWTPPAPPTVDPGTAPGATTAPGTRPAAAPYGDHQAYAPPAPAPHAGPHTAPQHGSPPSPGASTPNASTPGTPTLGTTPPSAPAYGSPPAPGAPAYGSPPTPGAPTYGSPPPYGGQPPAAPVPYGGPGYPSPGTPSPYAPQARTDGLAVASLATSVGGLVLLAGATGPVGIGLGIGSLARIRRTGSRGRGMAVAGIVVGAVGTIVLAFVVWAAVAVFQAVSSTAQQAQEVFGGSGIEELLQEGGGGSTGLEDLLGGSGLEDLLQEGSGAGGSSEQLDGLLGELQRQLEELGAAQPGVLPSYALPQDLAAGTCWSQLPQTYDLVDAAVVPCTSEHTSEIVARLTVTGAPATDLTVDDPVHAAAVAECTAAVTAIDPVLLTSGSVAVWLPHPDQVATGQTVAYCVHQDALGVSSSLVAPAGEPS